MKTAANLEERMEHEKGEIWDTNNPILSCFSLSQQLSAIYCVHSFSSDHPPPKNTETAFP